MKVISMVPSWTELLIECGVNVVGRTRFCIHPGSKVRNIPAIGGTKDLDWEKLKTLKADLLILDQEENLPWMKDQSPIPVLDTHVTSIHSVASEIQKMASALAAQEQILLAVAERWQKISNQKRAWDWSYIPGEIERLPVIEPEYKNMVYVIWKNPWMTVSKETLIGSLLIQLGAEIYLPDFNKKYPEFKLEDFDLKKTYFLFSSEPFPFHKKKKDLLDLKLSGSIVDGEGFSWFGLRSLKFLESLFVS